MILYLRSRAVAAVLLIAAGSLVAIVLPSSSTTATASPAGASSALGVLLALAAPAVAAWGCSRGDEDHESGGVRPVRRLDLVFVLGVTGTTAMAAGVLGLVGVAPVGIGAARAMVTFVGMILLARPFGWRTAALAPSSYVIAVLILGRGEDASHPAAWAWIAWPPEAAGAWIASVALLAAGVAVHLGDGRRGRV